MFFTPSFKELFQKTTSRPEVLLTMQERFACRKLIAAESLAKENKKKLLSLSASSNFFKISLPKMSEHSTKAMWLIKQRKKLISLKADLIQFFFRFRFGDNFLCSFQKLVTTSEKFIQLPVCPSLRTVSHQRFQMFKRKTGKIVPEKLCWKFFWQRGIFAENFGNLLICILSSKNMTPLVLLPNAPVVFLQT